MVDLTNFKIDIFPGVNDQAIPASSTEGCNGGFICASINNIIDEVNLLKTFSGASGGTFNFSHHDEVSNETTTYVMSPLAPFDFYIVDITFDNMLPFVDLYLIVSGQQRPLITTEESNRFTVENPFVETGFKVDLVMVIPPEAAASGIAEDVTATLKASFSPFS